MTMFGQNYGNFQVTSSNNVSIGSAISSNTSFYVNASYQHGAEIRATGFATGALKLYTNGYASVSLNAIADYSYSLAARFEGKTQFTDKVAIGTSPLTTSSHEKLAIRNGMITISGTGNGISLKGSYYGGTNSFGTQWYGLFMGNPATMNLSTDQTSANYTPIVLSSFYGLGFDVGGGKMALCQNGALYIGGNDAATKTRIQSTADLSISSLDYQLYVEKGIRTEKVKVDAKGNWPDFVFEDNYTLPSLTEIEQFITTNKHLPNVPSAAEVEKEGVDLGEMDKILLQKIEELTLYTIEQQKQLELLKKELELLKK